MKFWNMDTQSCFYTIAENVAEVYAFALINSDRLLVVGGAEVELLVFELSWLNDAAEPPDFSTLTIEREDLESKAKRTRGDNYVGSTYLHEESQQENVEFDFFGGAIANKLCILSDNT